MYGLIIGGIICVLVAFAGLVVKHKYKINADFLTAYFDFIELALIEITNNKTPICRIIEIFLARENNVFAKVLSEINSQLKKDCITIEGVSKEWILIDKKNINMLIYDITNIGKYDSLTEINKLNALKEKVALDKQKAVDKYKKDGVMAFKLSILIGFAIMILFA